MQIIRYKKNEFKTEFQKLIHKLITEKDHTKKIEIFEEIVQYLFRAREDAEELTHIHLQSIAGEKRDFSHRHPQCISRISGRK
jgi:hypothetical protein